MALVPVSLLVDYLLTPFVERNMVGIRSGRVIARVRDGLQDSGNQELPAEIRNQAVMPRQGQFPVPTKLDAGQNAGPGAAEEDGIAVRAGVDSPVPVALVDIAGVEGVPHAQLAMDTVLFRFAKASGPSRNSAPPRKFQSFACRTGDQRRLHPPEPEAADRLALARETGTVQIARVGIGLRPVPKTKR